MRETVCSRSSERLTPPKTTLNWRYGVVCESLTASVSAGSPSTSTEWAYGAELVTALTEWVSSVAVLDGAFLRLERRHPSRRLMRSGLEPG